jgi:hypothetical protein
MDARAMTRKSAWPAFVLIVAALTCVPLAAMAATPKKGAKYGGKVDRIANSRDPWVSLKVSKDGTKLKFIGPAESCDKGSGGFNPVARLHGRIKTVKVADDGKFRGSRKYDVPNDTGSVIYHWDIRVKGRFVSKDKAKGKVTFHMTHSGERSRGAVTDCGRRQIDFTAKRGAKWPGYLA